MSHATTTFFGTAELWDRIYTIYRSLAVDTMQAFKNGLILWLNQRRPGLPLFLLVLVASACAKHQGKLWRAEDFERAILRQVPCMGGACCSLEVDVKQPF